MTSRRPITIVELEQVRCGLRFDSCGAASGVKCYNTRSTCGARNNYDGAGSIKWRFFDGRSGVFPYGDFSDADNLATDPLPCLVSVTTAQSQINAGANLDGISPLGVTGKVTVTLEDFPWNDAVGDHYGVERPGYTAGRPFPVRGKFWALWTARNAFFDGMYLRIYDGFEGEELADMRQRLYVVDKVDGPNGDNKVTITGLDPLRLAGDKKAQFPTTSKLDLYGDLDGVSTSIQVFGEINDLTADFGNTGGNRYLVIGREIIRYTGYGAIGDGVFYLSGVERGALNTGAIAHADQDKVQRVGRYEAMPFWLILNDLYANHTEMPAEFIPLADWNAEGGYYLPTYVASRTIVAPTAVNKLAGQITQQGLFYIWWAEYEQSIKMLAIRAPSEAPHVLNDNDHLLAGSVLKRVPSSRLTQVSVFYEQIDVFGSDDPENYRKRYVAIDGDNQAEVRAHEIYALWITNRTQAVQLAVRLLIRYRAVPQFLSVTIDAKDRTVTVGDIADIETRSIVDTQGNMLTKRWQVISAKEIVAGHRYLLNCQTYEFLGRFGRYMGAGAPTYTSATDGQRSGGAWYSGASGLLSDNSEGFKYQ